MTISYKEFPDTKTIEIYVDGEISREEYNDIIIDMDRFIQNYGTVKLLEAVKTLNVGMDLSMFWEGLKFDYKNIRHISHCAVVSDIGWIGPMSKAAGALISTKLRTFKMDEIDAARAWLKDPDTAS